MNIGKKVVDSEEVSGIVDKVWVVDSMGAGAEELNSNEEMSKDFGSGESLKYK